MDGGGENVRVFGSIFAVQVTTRGGAPTGPRTPEHLRSHILNVSETWKSPQAFFHRVLAGILTRTLIAILFLNIPARLSTAKEIPP
jgi:hypothetical protein